MQIFFIILLKIAASKPKIIIIVTLAEIIFTDNTQIVA